MIRWIHPLSVGSAVVMTILPDDDAGYETIRVLRKFTDDFSGYDDPAAVLVYEGEVVRTVLDYEGVVDGQVHYYRAYGYDGAAWAASDTWSAVPQSNPGPLPVDFLDVVRERVELGLNALVAADLLSHPEGFFRVLTAPPLVEDTIFPAVSAHLESDASEQRFIGDFLSERLFDENLDEPWTEYTGYLSRWRINIVAWALNPDQRRTLRIALRQVLIANFPVLVEAGAAEIDLTVSDTEEMERYGAPVFMSSVQLSCLAPSVSEAYWRMVRDVIVTGETADPG